VRTQMNQQRDRQITALRTILNADQQKQLDANIAAWKERAAQRRHGNGDQHKGDKRGTGR
jgi:hypothetical protein